MISSFKYLFNMNPVCTYTGCLKKPASENSYTIQARATVFSKTQYETLESVMLAAKSAYYMVFR